MDVVLGFGYPGMWEMLIILMIGVLLFGKRLPEVGRSLGKGIVEFKKGIRGIEDDVDLSASSSSTKPAHDEADDRDEATAPKFEPPTSEPQAESAEPQAESAEPKAEPAESKAESAEA